MKFKLPTWLHVRKAEPSPLEARVSAIERVLESDVQLTLLNIGLQIDALLREHAKVRKEPLEFHTVPERVEVRRRG